MMRVTDLITMDEARAWKSGERITITGSTGSGKSHFIKNHVYEIARERGQKILFLVHRINCYDQFKLELQEDNKTDVIDLMTYQSIDMKSSRTNLKKYDYIVCDEFHYWMSDAIFNENTDISLEEILSQTSAITIFMSATSKYMKFYFKEMKQIATKDYELKGKEDFIEHLEFYYKDEALERYIDNAILEGKKAIFFIDDTKKAYELHKKYENETFFNCSRQNSYYQHVNEEMIKDMLKNNGFDKLNDEGSYDSTKGKMILITTSVMDAGVNIHMDNLKHIVCDIKDTEKLIQCIGRKRRKEGEKITLCIKALGNQVLGGIESSTKLSNKKADYLKVNGQIKYINKYGRSVDTTNTVYLNNKEDGNAELIVNEMRYNHNYIKCHEMQFIRTFDSKHNYCEYIKYKLNAKDYLIYDLEEQNDTLERYLNEIIGKKLFKDEQIELKEAFKKDGLSARTIGINTLNGNLKDRKLPFVITIGNRESYRDESGNVKKEKSHWIIGKISFQ